MMINRIARKCVLGKCVSFSSKRKTNVVNNFVCRCERKYKPIIGSIYRNGLAVSAPPAHTEDRQFPERIPNQNQINVNAQKLVGSQLSLCVSFLLCLARRFCV